MVEGTGAHNSERRGGNTMVEVDNNNSERFKATKVIDTMMEDVVWKQLLRVLDHNNKVESAN
ncbi:hypothetical protein SESBI_44806 [Sesbania bispinosa]|nr:hypothetical protein SESBI_44806 [Sesbania bispinosa]